MKVIYEPNGRAREYSPLALNVYNSCDFGCTYCYAKRFNRGVVEPRKDIIANLRKQLEEETITKQVLLSFLSDPYCLEEQEYKIMPQILEILLEFNIPIAILTKGVTVLRDFNLLKQFKRCQLGATLTYFEFYNKKHDFEPYAPSTCYRIDMLHRTYNQGIKTFVSFEPVISPLETFRLMEVAKDYAHHYRIGKWNHDKRANEIDWLQFGTDAVEYCRSINKPVYIKNDLAEAMPGFQFRAEERNPELYEI